MLQNQTDITKIVAGAKTTKNDENYKVNSRATKTRKDIEYSLRLKVHSEGILPLAILDVWRPNEPEVIKQYRKDVYKAKTQSAFGKVLGALGKLQQAEDWGIIFPESTVKEGETLEDYTTKGINGFGSLENYFFSFFLNKIITNPNGVCVVIPDSFDIPTTDFLKPFPLFFEEEDILYMDSDSILVNYDFRETETLNLNNETEESQFFLYVDSFKIMQIEKKGVEVIYTEYANPIGKIFFKNGGIVHKIKKNNIFYYSFVHNALDMWDEAVTNYSDHKANLLLHIHPEKWQLQTQECKTCHGHGQIVTDSGRGLCGDCQGSGYANTSPFGLIEIPAKNRIGEVGNMPLPPAGYLLKSTETPQFLREEIEGNIREGFSALGMEYLFESAFMQSGVAKEYDMEQAKTFISNFGAYIVNNWFKPVYELISKWRYQTLSEKEIKEMQPSVRIPQKFSTLSTQILSDRLKNATANNFGNEIKSSIQVEYAKREFGENSNVWKITKAINELNPLPDITTDEKSISLLNGAISLDDYILSENVNSFVKKAYTENIDFLDMDLIKMREFVQKYIQEVKDNKIEVVQPNG